MTFIPWLNALFHDRIFGSILLTFIFFIILVYLNWIHIYSFLKKIDKKTWFILILIFIIALSIRIFIPSHQHIIYIDESWYMEAGKDLLQTGHQQNYPKSIGWPFILRMVFGIFGVSNWVALYTSILFGALTIFTIFFMTFIITNNIKIGLISSIIFSLFPIHIRWSASAETNIVSIFFISLTIFIFYLYYFKKKNSLLWLALITLALTVQFRPENYVLIFLFIFGCFFGTFNNWRGYSVKQEREGRISGKFMYDKYFYKKINIKDILPFIAMIILSFANLVQVLDFQTSTNWIESDTGGKETGENWSIYNLMHNSLKYGINIFNGEHQPIILTAFMLIGLIYMLHKQVRRSLFLIIWFFLFWLVYFTSWFQTLAGGDRFYISFYPITVIFISSGILFFSDILTKKIKNIWIKKNLVWFILIFIILLFIPHIMGVKYSYSGNPQLLETIIPELAERDIPSDCIIIANFPTILKSTTDLNVIDIDLFLDNPKNQEKIFNYTKCVLFFEDYCCLDWNTYNFKEKCDMIKNDFSLEDFKSYKLKNNRYSFYKLNQKRILLE